MIKFVKVGDSIQCQNCGNMFKIDELKALKSKFTNWQGLKAV